MINLIQGDCLEEMRKLAEEDVKVDMVLTDLPYGTTACKWDNIIPFDEMWECLNNLSTNITSFLFFGTEPFSTNLRISNLNDYKYDWYWVKNISSGFVHCNNKPLKNLELISVFSKGTTVHKNQSKNRMVYNPQGLIEINSKWERKSSNFKNVVGARPSHTLKHIQKYTNYPKMTIEFDATPTNKRTHPTEKPVDLLKYLIKTYSNEEDTVLDFTMGSGSTGVACQELNRDFIGIELDKDYYNIANERIRESEKQRKLI